MAVGVSMFLATELMLYSNISTERYRTTFAAFLFLSGVALIFKSIFLHQDRAGPRSRLASSERRDHPVVLTTRRVPVYTSVEYRLAIGDGVHREPPTTTPVLG